MEKMAAADHDQIHCTNSNGIVNGALSTGVVGKLQL